MKQPIERIPVAAPLVSILSSISPLGVDYELWRSGIAWSVGACQPSHNWPRCAVAAPPENAPSWVEDYSGDKLTDGLGIAATDPFTIYTGVECEWIETTGGDKLVQVVQDLTNVHTAWGVSRALWLGQGILDALDPVYGVAPPTLRRAAIDVSVGGATAPLDDVVAALLHAYTECTGGSGGAVLHVPDVLIPSALGGGGGGARICWPEGNLYRAALGAVVSPGPGYPHGSSSEGLYGYGPLVSGEPPSEVYQGNGFDEVWVYVTGPVQYAVTDPEGVGTETERRQPFRRNRYIALSERQAIVRFDPCCVFAARATNDASEVS